MAAEPSDKRAAQTERLVQAAVAFVRLERVRAGKRVAEGAYRRWLDARKDLWDAAAPFLEAEQERALRERQEEQERR